LVIIISLTIKQRDNEYISEDSDEKPRIFLQFDIITKIFPRLFHYWMRGFVVSFLKERVCGPWLKFANDQIVYFCHVVSGFNFVIILLRKYDRGFYNNIVINDCQTCWNLVFLHCTWKILFSYMKTERRN